MRSRFRQWPMLQVDSIHHHHNRRKKLFDHHQRPNFNQIVKEINNFDWNRLYLLSSCFFFHVRRWACFFFTIHPFQSIIATQLVRLSCIYSWLKQFFCCIFAHCSYCRIFNDSFHFMATIECNKTQGIIKCIQSKNRTRFFFSQINWFCNFDFFFFIHRQILINTLRTSKMSFDSHRASQTRFIFHYNDQITKAAKKKRYTRIF